MSGNGEGLGAGVTIVVVIIIVLFLVMIACAVIAVFKPDLIKKFSKGQLDEGNAEAAQEGSGSREAEKIGDTKEFLPYKRLLDYCIDLGDYNYRTIIEVSSLNYGLMSSTEQQMVDATYRNFLDALDFPIEIYIQTREFDTQAVIDDLEERAKSSVKKYPNLQNYAQEYMYEMSGITKRFGNSKTKKKYVIVAFGQDDLQDVSELTKGEIDAFAQEELMQRCSIVLSGLQAVGLNAELLSRTRMAEVLYSYYHRDNFRIAEDIVTGNLTSLVVNGPEHRTDPRYKLDTILTKTQNSIRSLVDANTSDDEIRFYKYLCQEIDKYKQDDVTLDMAHLFYNTKEAAEREGFLEDYYRYVKTHPEADFSNLPEKDYNGGNITIPENFERNISDEEINSFRAEQEYLGGAEVRKEDSANIAEFDPNMLVSQNKRKGRRS